LHVVVSVSLTLGFWTRVVWFIPFGFENLVCATSDLVGVVHTYLIGCSRKYLGRLVWFIPFGTIFTRELAFVQSIWNVWCGSYHSELYSIVYLVFVVSARFRLLNKSLGFACISNSGLERKLTPPHLSQIPPPSYSLHAPPLSRSSHSPLQQQYRLRHM